MAHTFTRRTTRIRFLVGHDAVLSSKHRWTNDFLDAQELVRNAETNGYFGAYIDRVSEELSPVNGMWRTIKTERVFPR